MGGTPCLSDIETYLAPYGRFFGRAEARMLAARYIQGLLTEGGRKSVEPMAQRLGVPARSLQRLLNRAVWDHHGVLQAYRERMVDLFSGREGVLVIGQTIFPKRGNHSVCVARQYNDETGRMISSQTAAESVYAVPGLAFPWAMDLYVPTFWARPRNEEFRHLRQKVGIPARIRHQERWELAISQVDLAVHHQLGMSMVTAGASIGRIAAFRDALDVRGLRYILEIPPETTFFTKRPVLREYKPKKRGRGRPRKRHRILDADTPPVSASEEAIWSGKVTVDTHTAGSGTSSDTSSRLQSARVWPAEGYREGILHEPVWLVRRPGVSRGAANGYRYYLGNHPTGFGLEDIARATAACRDALACRNTMIHDLGLLHHEGRTWTGWHRHVVLVFLALGFLLENRTHIHSVV